MALNKHDVGQIIKKQTVELNSTEMAQRVIMAGGDLVTEQFDRRDYTYVASGDGVGQVETITYYFNDEAFAVVTYTYNADDKVASEVRTPA